MAAELGNLAEMGETIQTCSECSIKDRKAALGRMGSG